MVVLWWRWWRLDLGESLIFSYEPVCYLQIDRYVCICVRTSYTTPIVVSHIITSTWILHANSECRVSSKKRQMPAFLLVTRVGDRICGASKEVSQPTTTPSPSNAFLRLCAG